MLKQKLGHSVELDQVLNVMLLRKAFNGLVELAQPDHTALEPWQG